MAFQPTKIPMLGGCKIFLVALSIIFRSLLPRPRNVFYVASSGAERHRPVDGRETSLAQGDLMTLTSTLHVRRRTLTKERRGATSWHVRGQYSAVTTVQRYIRNDGSRFDAFSSIVLAQQPRSHDDGNIQPSPVIIAKICPARAVGLPKFEVERWTVDRPVFRQITVLRGQAHCTRGPVTESPANFPLKVVQQKRSRSPRVSQRYLDPPNVQPWQQDRSSTITHHTAKRNTRSGHLVDLPRTPPHRSGRGRRTPSASLPRTRREAPPPLARPRHDT